MGKRVPFVAIGSIAQLSGYDADLLIRMGRLGFLPVPLQTNGIEGPGLRVGIAAEHVSQCLQELPQAHEKFLRHGRASATPRKDRTRSMVSAKVDRLTVLVEQQGALIARIASDLGVALETTKQQRQQPSGHVGQPKLYTPDDRKPS